MRIFTVLMAGLPIRIHCRHSYSEQLCKDYIVSDREVELDIRITEEELRREQERSMECKEAYVESLCIQRKIAEELPERERFLMHGAAICYRNRAYLFTAPSGTGKTTHIRLWREYLGEAVTVINGDKPFLSVEEERVTVWGSPWAGKERWQQNIQAPLQGFCILKQAENNHIRRLSPEEGVSDLLRQIYWPEGGESAAKTLELLDCILEQIPIYQLECNISEDAVRTSFEAMTGNIFKE